MNRLLAWICMVVLLISCGEEVIKKPENLIPKEKMAAILHDLAVMNAAKTSFGSAFDKTGIEIMDFLYEKYGIDSVQFVESDLYYASVPLEYQSIYEDVEARLDKRKSIMDEASKKVNDSVREAQKIRQDSIKSIQENEPSEP